MTSQSDRCVSKPKVTVFSMGGSAHRRGFMDASRECCYRNGWCVEMVGIQRTFDPCGVITVLGPCYFDLVEG